MARAGDNVGMLLRGVEKDAVERGMVVSAPGSIESQREANRTIDAGTVTTIVQPD